MQKSSSESDLIFPAFEPIDIGYNQQKPRWNHRDKELVNQIIEYLIVNPKIKVQFEGHSDGSIVRKYEHYHTLKILEELESLLIENGINSNRISVVSKGGNYPLISGAATNEEALLSLNRRIKYLFYSQDYKQIAQSRNLSNRFSEKYLDPRGKVHSLNVKGVSYRIEFAREGKLIESDYLIDLPDPMIEKIQGERRYSYSVGLFKSLEKAMQFKRELSVNRDETFIVIPYKNGLRLSDKHINNMLVEFPELNNLRVGDN